MTGNDSNERNSFILYSSYEELLDMLSDEQAGQLIKQIFVYARTQKKTEADPMVNMAMAVIAHQMDIDTRKYQESKERRREAGKKGGRPRINSVESEDEKDIKAKLFSENQSKDMKPVDVYVDDDKYVDVDGDVYEDVDAYGAADAKENQCGGGEREEEERARTRKIVYFTDNQYPTIQAEKEKFMALANELMAHYCRKYPSAYDLEQVFTYTSSHDRLDDDTVFAVCDAEKAELLRYAFRLAADAGNANWSYVDGIYVNFHKRNIACVTDAYLYEWERKYGGVAKSEVIV